MNVVLTGRYTTITLHCDVALAEAFETTMAAAEARGRAVGLAEAADEVKAEAEGHHPSDYDWDGWTVCRDLEKTLRARVAEALKSAEARP